MQYFATVVLALAATAFALPQQEGGSKEGKESKGTTITVEQAQEQCNGGNAQQLSCCNSNSEDGLLSILDDLSILGGDCSQIAIPIAVLGVAQSEQAVNYCSGNQVACCPAGTSGSSTGCTAL